MLYICYMQYLCCMFYIIFTSAIVFAFFLALHYVSTHLKEDDVSAKFWHRSRLIGSVASMGLLFS